jgi:hypothetical protein
VIEPEPDTVPPVTFTSPAEIDPLTVKLPALTFNPPAVMVVTPVLVKDPPVTLTPFESTLAFAKVTFPELIVIPFVETISLATFTSPVPVAFTLPVVIGPPVMDTWVELGLAKATALGLTPPPSTVTLAVLVKDTVSPVRKATDTPAEVFQSVLDETVFQRPLASANVRL